MDLNSPGQPLWEMLARRAPTTAVPTRDLSADLCVVGLGGTGLSAVLAALERGLNVVGVDAGGIVAGTAGRNGGFLLAGAARFHHRVVAEHGRDRARRLYLATLDQMDAMERETPQWARRAGSLRVAVDEEEPYASGSGQRACEYASYQRATFRSQVASAACRWGTRNIPEPAGPRGRGDSVADIENAFLRRRGRRAHRRRRRRDRPRGIARPRRQRLPGPDHDLRARRGRRTGGLDRRACPLRLG